MIRKILLRVPQVAHHADKQIRQRFRTGGAVADGGGVILDDQVFDLCQFVGYALVIVLVLGVEPGVLMLNMRAYLLHKLVVAP